MYTKLAITPEVLAQSFVELLPGYLPGLDTGAFEATDRRRCWNKTLQSILTLVAKRIGLNVTVQPVAFARANDQLVLTWEREGVPVFTATTGWGDRKELDLSLQWLESFKSPEKLLIYTCGKWQEAVLEQFSASLLHYPYHTNGEKYLLLNLLGAEKAFHLYVFTPESAGKSLPRDGGALHPLRGSPFRWEWR